MKPMSLKLSFRRLNDQGFSHVLLVLLFVVVAFGLVGAYMRIAGRADTISFTYLGTHPQAAAQPTAMGKTLITLKGYNNKIYAGYGDYSANTGPIALTPFDLSTNSFASTPEYTQSTMMIGEFRIFGDKLFSPSLDMRGPNYAYGDASSGSTVWKDYSWGNDPTHATFMIHVFDMNTTNGSDIWMAGSSNQDATAFRSTDGGANWTEMRRKVGDDTKFFRYYGVVTLNGKAYVQPMGVSNTTNVVLAPESSSDMYSNGSWSKGPNLLSQGGYVTWHPSEFAGKAVYFTWASADSIGSECLKVFNGSSVGTSCPDSGLTDYTIDGDTLYGINYGQVYSTKDLKTWYLQGTAPSNAVSIAVMNGKIYVGTRDSKLYSAPVNPNPGSAGGGTTTPKPCHGKKCGGDTGGGGGGGSTCHGKKCQTADAGTKQ
jgi:hypothetical protein